MLAPQSRLTDETLACALCLLRFLLGYLFRSVVFGHIGLFQKHEVIKELLVIGLFPFVGLAIGLVHDQCLSSVEQVLGRRHLGDAIGQVTLRGEIVFQAGRTKAENLEWAIFHDLMLSNQSTYQFIAMLAHELLICSLTKVHDKVGRVETERFGHSEQVAILIDESNLFLSSASLNYSCIRQDNILALCEKYHVLLL